MSSVPAPPETPETAAWWDATRERRLTVQGCRNCGHRQHHPRSVCTRCHDRDLELIEVSGRGHVLSFSVVHRSPDPQLRPPPYVVALVQLEEGPVLTSNIVDVEPGAVHCDQPLTIRWRALDDGRHLPVFTPDIKEP